MRTEQHRASDHLGGTVTPPSPRRDAENRLLLHLLRLRAPPAGFPPNRCDNAHNDTGKSVRETLQGARGELRVQQGLPDDTHHNRPSTNFPVSCRWRTHSSVKSADFSRTIACGSWSRWIGLSRWRSSALHSGHLGLLPGLKRPPHGQSGSVPAISSSRDCDASLDRMRRKSDSRKKTLEQSVQ